MITKVNFSNYTLNSNLFRRNQTKNSSPNFKGILDNPEARRVTNGKGVTYIVEPGGHIVVHGDTSNDKVKTLGTAAATGAGTSVAASKISGMRNDKAELEESHSNHGFEDSHHFNSTDTDIDTSDGDDVEFNEPDDVETIIDDDGDDDGDDDDDDGDF